MPNHWVSKAVSMLGKPIITTSVNITDKPFMVDLDDLDPEIKKSISFALYEGPKQGRPSKLIHLEEEKTRVQER